MRVRAKQAFSAYRPENCTIIGAEKGQEFADDVARYLLDTHAPVVEIEDPAPAVSDAQGVSVPVDETPVQRVDDDPAPPPAFDPADHTVDEVLAYAEANPDQRGAVRLLEATGKARTTILKNLAD